MATDTQTETDTLDVALPTGANISTSSILTSQPRQVNNGYCSSSKSSTPVPTPPPPPPMTTSRSEYYQDRLADISSRATVTDPMNVIFAQDKSGPATVVTAELLYPAARARVTAKVKAGSFIAEAANFAAVVCWEPPGAVAPFVTETELGEMARTRPVFSRFVRDMQGFKVATFGLDQPYWNMSLMARDPDRNDKGAVRAVIEPFVARARREGVPIWLCAANERARDVYAHFGFRVVGIVYSSLNPKDGDVDNRDGEGQGDAKEVVMTWCMCCNWPVEPVSEHQSGSEHVYEHEKDGRNGNQKGNGSGSGSGSGSESRV